MKIVRCVIMGIVFATGISMSMMAWAGQDQASSIERDQVRKNIQIIEGVLNTVRQQVVASVAANVFREGDPNHPAFMFLHAGEGNRTEGIYLEGYGVIFEVYLPNFSEQRSINWIFKNTQGLAAQNMGRAREASVPIVPGPSNPGVEAKPEFSPSALNALSKLVDSYMSESQNKNREMALRDLMSKLREADFFPQMSILEYSPLEGGTNPNAEKSSKEESKSSLQRKQLQNAIMKAVADYGSSISGLLPSEYITVFLKSPDPNDFSIISPETRTSTIIRFSVRDLRDYKTGRISYADLLAKTKIEGNE